MATTEHNTLAEAKVAFQGDAPKLHKGNTAEVVSKRTGGKYSYKYVDLADIVEAIQPLMLKHGLAFSAFPCFGPDGNPALRYELEHASGDKEADVMPLLAVPDAQALGSAITYMRRYALCAVLNIVADADDDGAAAKAAQDRARAQNGSPQPTAAPAQQTDRPASAKQRGMLNARAAEASLCPSDFANAVLVGSGKDARSFENQDHAQEWLNRALDRLPAKYVDAVLAEIKRMGDEQTEEQGALV